MKYKYILSIVLAGACLSACHDFRNDYMVNDTVYMRSETDALIQDFSVYDAQFRIGVIKAGKGLSPSTVEIGIAPTDSVLAYNERHSTGYLPLPKSLYNADEIDGTVLNFTAGEARQKVDVKWDPRAMVTKMTTETDAFVIPVFIRKADLAVSTTKYMVLVRPVLSTLSVRALDNPMTCKEESVATAKVGVKLDHAIPNHNVIVKFHFDPAATTVNGIDYVAAPAGSVTLPSGEATIKAGDIETDIEVAMDMNKVGLDVSHIAGIIKIDAVEVVTENGNLDFMPVTEDEMVVRVTKTKKS